MFLILPLVTFSAIFVSARQLRIMENVPGIANVFVKRRLLTSAVIGTFISAVIMVPVSFATGFGGVQLLAFVASSALASACSYLGFRIGWGVIQPADEKKLPAADLPATGMLSDNCRMEDSSNLVRLTVHSKPRWVLFSLALLQLL